MEFKKETCMNKFINNYPFLAVVALIVAVNGFVELVRVVVGAR